MKSNLLGHKMMPWHDTYVTCLVHINLRHLFKASSSFRRKLFIYKKQAFNHTFIKLLTTVKNRLKVSFA
jgi:uncharacterized membrane protein YesL